MKKKIALLLAAALTVSTLVSCGKDAGTNADSTEPSISAELLKTVDLDSLSDVAENKPVEDYITLGEYKGVKVSLPKIVATQSEIDELALQLYTDNVTEDNGVVKDRPISIGDTANIDYVGKKDGVAFAGGTAEGYNLAIGSGSFIAGFEEGLVGVTPGEVVDLNLTFPENYHSADLAGAEVVFTVTVNYLLPTAMEDKVVKAFGKEEFKNVEELKKYAEDFLNETNNSKWQSDAEYEVIATVMENAEIKEIPEELMEAQRNIVNTTLSMFANYYGITAEDYTMYFYGMDLATFVELQAEDYAKQQLVYQAIANKEGLNVSDRDLTEKLLQEASKKGAASIEAFLGDTDKEEYRDSMMLETVYNFIQENAEITAE